MRFVVAGGGVAELATAQAVARAGYTAVVLERDIETIFGRLMATPPPPAGPPHGELLARAVSADAG